MNQEPKTLKEALQLLKKKDEEIQELKEEPRFFVIMSIIYSL